MNDEVMRKLLERWKDCGNPAMALLGSALLGDMPEVTASLTQLRYEQAAGSLCDTVRNVTRELQEALHELDRQWTEINGE